MLSRYMAFQVKQNSYFLFGLCVGLWVALMVVPYEDDSNICPNTVFNNEVTIDDEYSPQREEKVAGVSGAAAGRSIQRPRYYSTELGMRAPLLAGIVTSEDALDTWASAINSTATLQAIKFFMSAHTRTAPAKPNVVGFTDTREMLKPFHALKYLADNYLEEYDFFFLASDASYVNAQRLMELVSHLSVSQDVYMGVKADDDSDYCTLDNGIIISNSVLRRVHSTLDWCVRNSYSAHHHENLGRCFLHAAGTPCRSTLQGETYTSVRGEVTPGPAVADAITVGPLTDYKRIHELHAYVSRLLVQRALDQEAVLSSRIASSITRHPPEHRESAWPPGLRREPGDPPKTPADRFEHLRWTTFNATHVLMPNDHHAIAPLSGSYKEALDMVLSEVYAWWAVNRETTPLLVGGAWRWNPPTDMTYRLLLSAHTAQDRPNPQLHSIEVVRGIGSSRPVPTPYVTESRRISLAVITADQASVALATALRGNDNRTDVIASLCETSPDQDYQSLLASLERVSSRRVKCWRGGAGTLVARTVPRGTLLMVIKPDLQYTDDFLNRVRMNTIQGVQWYRPIPFARYAVFAHPAFSERVNTGRFHADGSAAAIAAYAGDIVDALEANPELESKYTDEIELYAAVLTKTSLRCIRAPEPGGIITPPKRVCKGSEHDLACLKNIRNIGFNHLELGAKHSLAKLLLQTQDKVDMTN